jgi:enoyl-CoA hydratase/carnithine racemase
LHQTYTTTVPKPVIGAINGACAGLGLVQASMFDVRFAADEAKVMGLVNKVFPAENLLDETMAYAADIAANVAPASTSVIKRQLTDGWDRDLEVSNADTTAKMNYSLRQADFKEGVQSFVERRPPNFSPVAGREQA